MISGVILARNEEANIVACLEALRPHVGEILLIDMESEDRTVELAGPYVSEVLDHPLVANFDAARNIAIPEAQFDWFWFVDADERLSERTGKVVNDLVRERGDEFEALNIPFKSYFCGQWMQHCGWWPGYTMPRVLKRGHFKFSERLHGGVEVNGRQLRLPPDPELGVDHFSYESVEHYIKKFNPYTTTEAAQMATEGKTWDWRDATRHMMHDLWQYYEQNEGKLDGTRGWILSWLAGQYRWFSHAKLIDSENQGGGNGTSLPENSVPESLDEVLQVMETQLASLRRKAPELPLGVVWRSPIWDPSGYADEGRAFAKALSRSERPLLLEDLAWSDKRCAIPDGDAALFTALSRARRPRYTAAITNCIPTLAQPDPLASVNILRTTFETDHIPTEWIPHILAFDEVWVISQHNARAFRRSGIPPERIRVVPSCLDTERFSGELKTLKLPEGLADRFVFLSVFDWQLRKGWDLLLAAYCQEFSADEGVGLLLKISRAQGHPLAVIRQQADTVLQAHCQSLANRPDIVFWDETLEADQMASLYHSVDAFVLPSRGEGWGRPYMEAMACGLPTIGTGASGNVDFMDPSNSFLIPAKLVEVSEAAAREIPPYRGHRWFEPDSDELRRLMRLVRTDKPRRQQVAECGKKTVFEFFNLKTGTQAMEQALQSVEARFVQENIPPASDDQVRAAWEGELFAGHSFANINEKLSRQLSQHQSLALSINRVYHNPAFDAEVPDAHQILPYVDRELPGGPQVTVRHAFPPNWEPPASGRWVHIQPWEFGHLPRDWIKPLRDQVDEIWVPSHYVKRVYVDSGIPAEKVQVIPWGIDPQVFNPAAPDLLLPTKKRFKFLFVGGTIARKGFDVLLESYLEEFGPEDDVCLVIKDLGTKTFYRYGNFRDQVLAARDDPTKPEIVYMDDSMTEGQLASLYTACDCLVAPYRGEGFGLPILEAMACGLPPIVPEGGPTDDFVSQETGYFLPSREVETHHDWQLCGPALELSVTGEDLRTTMRHACQHLEEIRQKGERASHVVIENLTWEKTASQMIERIDALTESNKNSSPVTSAGELAAPPARDRLPTVAAWVRATEQDALLADFLCRLRPFVDDLIVLDSGLSERGAQIAGEYEARVLPQSHLDQFKKKPVSSEADWSFEICGNFLPKEEDLSDLKSRLAAVTDDHCSLTVSTEIAEEDAKAHGQASQELTFFRNVSTSSGNGSRNRNPEPSAQVAVLESPSRVAPAPSSGIERFREPIEYPPLLMRGKQHLDAGNPFHAEAYLNDFYRQIDHSHELFRDTANLLIAAQRATSDPYRAVDVCHEVLEMFPNDPQWSALLPSLAAEIELLIKDPTALLPQIESGTQPLGNKIYLGAGQKRLAGYTHVDVAEVEGIDTVWNLNHRPWPWEDNSVDLIVAEDLVEHLEINLIEFCNEAWRVLSPGGELFVRTPHHNGDSSWIDPTHRWHLDERSFHYLDPATVWGRQFPHYTDRKWQLTSLGVRGPQNICAVLTTRK